MNFNKWGKWKAFCIEVANARLFSIDTDSFDRVSNLVSCQNIFSELFAAQSLLLQSIIDFFCIIVFQCLSQTDVRGYQFL